MKNKIVIYSFLILCLFVLFGCHNSDSDNIFVVGNVYKADGGKQGILEVTSEDSMLYTEKSNQINVHFEYKGEHNGMSVYTMSGSDSSRSLGFFQSEPRDYIVVPIEKNGHRKIDIEYFTSVEDQSKEEIIESANQSSFWTLIKTDK